MTDSQLLELWRAVNGPASELNGPLIRFAASVSTAALAEARAPQAERKNTVTSITQHQRAKLLEGLQAWPPDAACAPDSPFEYDQGDILIVWYDDLYDLRRRAEAAEAALVSLREQQAELPALEMASAQLRGMQDFLSGQPGTPDDQPYGRVVECRNATHMQLNFAWTLGYQQAAESTLFVEMVRRADAAANRSDKAAAELVAFKEAADASRSARPQEEKPK